MQTISTVCPAQDLQHLPFKRVSLPCDFYLLWITMEVGSVSYVPSMILTASN